MGESLKQSGLIKGTYRMRRICRLKLTPNGTYAELRCKSFYFEDREAVTFNPDGFIGFAGWADDYNVQPVLETFMAWVSEFSLVRASEVAPVLAR